MKAQVQGQIFIYILAIIVVGGILLYGYSAIKDFGEKGEEVAFLSFKTSFENTVKSMVSDYGTIKRPEFDVPANYRYVCVIDIEKAKDNSNLEVIPTSSGGNPSTINAEPIISATWTQIGSQLDKSQFTAKDITLSNVFLTPDGSQSFHVDNLKVAGTNRALCAPVKGGKVKLQFKSVGNGVEVSIYE